MVPEDHRTVKTADGVSSAKGKTTAISYALDIAVIGGTNTAALHSPLRAEERRSAAREARLAEKAAASASSKQVASPSPVTEPAPAAKATTKSKSKGPAMATTSGPKGKQAGPANAPAKGKPALAPKGKQTPAESSKPMRPARGKQVVPAKAAPVVPAKRRRGSEPEGGQRGKTSTPAAASTSTTLGRPSRAHRAPYWRRVDAGVTSSSAASVAEAED